MKIFSKSNYILKQMKRILTKVLTLAPGAIHSVRSATMKTQSASVLITTPPVLPPHLFAKPTVLSTTVPQRKRYRLPSVLMRSGTSRGLFIHRHHLPRSHAEWGAILIGAMGSRNGDPRQLDGVGGATSTTSKAVVVSKSDRPGIDIEYTFVQITVGQEKVDMTGNCGNMASGVAAFALEEGLVKAAPGQSEVSISCVQSIYKTIPGILSRSLYASDICPHIQHKHLLHTH